jgi:hypothetical protein
MASDSPCPEKRVQILWRIFGQQPRLTACERWPLSPGVEDGPQPGDRRASIERLITHEAPGAPEPGGPYPRLAGAIRAFEVFPPRLLTGVLRRVPVQAGDTIGSCFHALPGVDLFFPGRVLQSFDEFRDDMWRAGFTFRTVQGHPLIGEECFCVEKDPASGAVSVRIESWSRPALWLTRLATPFLRRLQTRAVNAALDHLSRLASPKP